MSDEGKDSSTFDSLVSEISKDERKDLLDKLRPDKSGDGNTYKKDSPEAELDVSLSSQMKKLSFFKRLLFWLKAIFTNQSIEVVFNNYLVSNISRGIERNYPGLIDYKRKVLYSVFYEKFTQLRTAAEFFKPFIDSYNVNSGSFYVLMCNIVIPTVSSQITEQTDPYQYPFSKEVNNEMRLSLIHRQDEILNGISQEDKVSAYTCIRGVEWLKKFVDLPFFKMISTFTSPMSDEKISYFTQIGTYFNEFSKVMCNSRLVTEEGLKALYLFDRRKNSIKTLEETETDPGINSFMEKASAQLSIINMFVSSVPVREISCIIFNNSQFVPEPCGGGEDWFVKFKNQWKTMLNHRWDMWLKDSRKEKLKDRLVEYFNMTGFPLFPFRPWAKISGNFVFQYEMTLGFIYAFFKNEFVFYVPTLKAAAFEGEFTVRENRVEFSDTLNALNKLNDELDSLANQLSAAGEYGMTFGKYEGEEKLDKSSNDVLEALMDDIDKETLSLINSFGKCCRSMENLMNGMLSEHITAYYGPISNLDAIKGTDNKKFKDQLMSCKYGLSHAFELVKELEPLDLPIQEGDI